VEVIERRGKFGFGFRVQGKIGEGKREGKCRCGAVVLKSGGV